MRFVKMHGAGNDYVYVDGFRDPLPQDPGKTARMISDRHKGIGADGLILICPSNVADAEMRMYNADGSPSDMCGNGIRCVAKYLFDRKKIQHDELTIATGDGIKRLQIFSNDGLAHHIRVDMGIPQLHAASIPTLLTGTNANEHVINTPFSIGDHDLLVTCVSMGNPHCVIFTDQRDPTHGFPTDELVLSLGPRIEIDARFPRRVNVELVCIDSDQKVHQRTWERGSGETLACGTGASAVCVAGVLTGNTQRSVAVHLRGGKLDLEWDATTNHVFMTGPAAEVFHGEIELE